VPHKKVWGSEELTTLKKGTFKKCPQQPQRGKLKGKQFHNAEKPRAKPKKKGLAP